MDINIEQLKTQLCQTFCTDIKVINKKNSFLIETPFSFPDGDLYQIYLEPLSMGGFRLKDGGHTLMHLSYENDIESFKRGNKNILLENIKSEFDIKELDGEFFVECTAVEIADNIFKLGQALTKICDITFLNKTRVQKTFYEGLDNELIKNISEKKIQKNYIFEHFHEAEYYPIDYNIITEKKNEYFFIFAVPNKDKAQLCTIILEKILRKQIENTFKFNSLTVFDDIVSIPTKIMGRLLNVGGEFVSIQNKENLKRKLKKVA